MSRFLLGVSGFSYIDFNFACKLGSRLLSEPGFTGFPDFQDLET